MKSIKFTHLVMCVNMYDKSDRYALSVFLFPWLFVILAFYACTYLQRTRSPELYIHTTSLYETSNYAKSFNHFQLSVQQYLQNIKSKCQFILLLCYKNATVGELRNAIYAMRFLSRCYFM